MEITKETRLESFFKAPTGKRQKMILEVLGDNEMTANEIRKALGFRDSNAVRPRITELKKRGIIKAVGIKEDKDSGRNVAVFKRVKKQ